MAEYGLTPKGPNIKRLDVILDEMHTELSKKWGVNTRQNPESFLNDLLTSAADKMAELWEFGEDVYNSHYPSTAEGISLDNAAQFGGTTRETASKSYYPIHCTGKDGTVLAAGTILSSATNPPTQLSLTEAREITRAAFNKVVVKIAAITPNSPYTVAINGAVYSFSSITADPMIVMSGLKSSIKEKGFGITLDYKDITLSIEANDPTSTNELILSENLTTETVTSIITFGTVDTGDILLPEGVITNIVKADSGLQSVVNLCSYIAGHDEESDSSLRQSYADKIFNRSTNMLESIRSSILQHVLGVVSVAPYENPSHEWDDHGRPPHSIEIVVDGGDSQEIAKEILNNKAGGINTYGDTVVVLPGEYDEPITIRFSRPEDVYVWFHLGITLSKTEALPPNYAELLRNTVLDNMAGLPSGTDVIPQQFVSKLFAACSGLSYIDIKLFSTTSSIETPVEYPDRSVNVTVRQRALTAESMIEVEIDG